MLNVRFIVKMLGVMFILETFFMLAATVVAFLYRGSDVYPLLISSGILFGTGFLFYSMGFKANEHSAGRREGRVVGDGVEGVIGGLVCHGANCLRDVRDNGGVDAGVLEAHLHIVCTRAAGKGDKPRGIGDALEVDVVDPRDIVAVGVVVIEEESAESAACRLDGLDLSIEAYGILGQVGLDGAAGDIPAPHTTAGVPHLASGRHRGAL